MTDYYFYFTTPDREVRDKHAATIANAFKLKGMLSKTETVEFDSPDSFGRRYGYRGIVTSDREPELQGIIFKIFEPNKSLKPQEL